eukprot:12624470-Alexandrium_andersonii.AAC.1
MASAHQPCEDSSLRVHGNRYTLVLRWLTRQRANVQYRVQEAICVVAAPQHGTPCVRVAINGSFPPNQFPPKHILNTFVPRSTT